MTKKSTTTFQFDYACLGGTFDRIHGGHKLLLQTALKLAKRVLIGVTTDELARRGKKLPELIYPYEKRVQDVIDFLQDKDEEVFIEKECAKALEVQGYNLGQINKQSDIVVTIGGDGTILHALTEIDKPLFSINSGGMGFLAEVESKYAIGGISRVLEKRYNIEERAKLKITVDGKRLPDAANEKMRQLRCQVMDIFV